MIQDGVQRNEKICNFVPFTIKFIARFNENVTNFCFTTYVASLDIQKQRKVRLLECFPNYVRLMHGGPCVL